MKSGRVFISGGAGFIGSFLCEHYLSSGCQVWCVDNLLTGDKDNLPLTSRGDSIKFINRDIASMEISDLPGDFDYVFHLASPASPNDYFKYPLETLRVNSAGTERCLDIALQSGARFVFSSTSEVYGDPLVPVQNENYAGNVNPVGPRSVYDEGKRYGEALVAAYCRKYGVNAGIVRIFNTYGPRMRIDDGRVIPNFISQALAGRPLTVYGDGKQTRSFCYVGDLVRGIAAMAGVDYHLPVNLGNPCEVTILNLAEMIGEVLGIKTTLEFLPALEDDPRRRKPDISRAGELLGWSPEVSMEEGIRKTAEDFRERMSR